MEFKPSGLDIKSMDGFSTSIGGPAGVPSVVKAMTRLFLTQSVSVLMCAIICEIMLTSCVTVDRDPTVHSRMTIGDFWVVSAAVGLCILLPCWPCCITGMFYVEHVLVGMFSLIYTIYWTRQGTGRPREEFDD